VKFFNLIVYSNINLALQPNRENATVSILVGDNVAVLYKS